MAIQSIYAGLTDKIHHFQMSSDLQYELNAYEPFQVQPMYSGE